MPGKCRGRPDLAGYSGASREGEKSFLFFFQNVNIVRRFFFQATDALALVRCHCRYGATSLASHFIEKQNKLLGQLTCFATQVNPHLQAPLSLLLGYVGVATASTVLEANKLSRRALVWAQTLLRTHVHDSFSCWMV